MKQIKFYSLLIVLVLFSSINVFAYDFEVGGIYYNKGSNNTATVTSGDNPYSGAVTIPENVENGGITYVITSIGEQAFENCILLKSVIIGNNVTSIGYRAFYGCSDLKAINFPDNIKEFGNIVGTSETFKGCSSLTEVKLGKNVSAMGSRVFQGCTGITTVTIEEGCSLIGYLCFNGCTNLQSVNIPNSVKSIEEYAFSECSSLKTVVIGNGVTEIGNEAFRDCKLLSSVVLGEEIRSIGYRAFYNCSGLKTINFPDNIKEFGNIVGTSDTFMGCSSLTEVKLGKNVSAMGSRVFQGCTGITTVTIEEGCSLIGEGCFNGCTNLESVNIPNSVKSIEADAFSECSSLKTVVIGNGVTEIGNEAFRECKLLSSVVLGEEIRSIGYRAFYNCSGLKTINFPDNIKEYVKSVGSSDTFMGCSSLTEVKLGKNVSAMGSRVFQGCTGITTVTIEEGCSLIGEGCFNGCTNLESVNIPNSVKSIEADAFSGCSSLKTVIIGDGVTKLGSEAFRECKLLSSVVLGEEIRSIGYRAFYNCSGLKTINFPDNIKEYVKSVGSSDTFMGCSSLTEVKLGKNVSVMGSGVFQGCTGITDVIIENGCLVIGEKCFNGCAKIKNIYNYCTELPSVNSNSFSNYNATLYVVKESVETYKATSPWSGFAEIDTAPYVKYMVDDVFTGEEQLFVINDTIVPLAKPEKVGYTFYGWDDVPVTMPANDVIAKGKFVINVYKLTYLLDGTEYKKYDIEYNASITPEAAPQDREGYTFSGWSEIPAFMPAKDVTVKGSFNINSYVIKYIINGVEYKKETLKYGSKITPPRTDSEGRKVEWEIYPGTMPAYDYEVNGTVVTDYVWLTVKDGLSGSTKIRVAQGDSLMLSVTVEEGWKVLSVTMDDNDVTEQLSDGKDFMTPALMNDAMITIVYEEEGQSNIASARASDANIKVVDDGVVISNAASGTRCAVYSANGTQVLNTTIDGSRKISLQKGQVYVLLLGNRTLKFAL